MEQIQENEQTRTEMLEENETINEKQKRMAYEVAELEMRWRTLAERVEQAETNVSRKIINISSMMHHRGVMIYFRDM